MLHLIVVVGASLAGLRAVETLRERGFDGELTLIGDDGELRVLNDTPTEGVREKVDKAVRGCPTGAISIKE